VTNHSAANFEAPEWAYPPTPRDFKPNPDDGKPKRLVAAYSASKMPRRFRWHISLRIWR
jgi:hypothetical protein